MVDFKEAAYEIFKICTDIRISDGHASEKIANILKNMYEEGLNNRKSFTEEDFTENELKVLKLAFVLVDRAIEIQRTSNYDNDDCNALFNLKEKLKIDGIV